MFLILSHILSLSLHHWGLRGNSTALPHSLAPTLVLVSYYFLIVMFYYLICVAQFFLLKTSVFWFYFHSYYFHFNFFFHKIYSMGYGALRRSQRKSRQNYGFKNNQENKSNRQGKNFKKKCYRFIIDFIFMFSYWGSFYLYCLLYYLLLSNWLNYCFIFKFFVNFYFYLTI